MSYTAQNFSDGQVLHAAELNAMEAALLQHDGDIAALQQFVSRHGTVQTGSITLTNSLEFPFNNSYHTIALTNAQSNTDYIVLTEIEDFTGNVGEVAVVDKMTNGFALEFSGSASSVTVNYVVIGGFSE